MYKAFFLLIIFSGIIQKAVGQITFSHLSVNNGLSQSTVLSICKDSRGYLWFGTRNCLNRYDSRNIKIYANDPADTSSISTNDYIYALFEDADKNLWIGTQSGLNRYLPESDSFERIYSNPKRKNSLSDNSVLCIFQDRRGSVWFGTNNGLSCLPNPNSRSFVNYKAGNKNEGLAGNEIYAIYEDRKGSLWVGSTNGLTRMTFKNGRYQFKIFRHSALDPWSISSNSVKAIAEDLQGNLWIGTENDGLNLFREETGSFVRFFHNRTSNSLSNNAIRKIINDHKGTLWIGTKDGLTLFDPVRRQYKICRNDQEDAKSLSDNSIKDIYQDKTGSVWIGTMYGGVNISHPGAFPFSVYKYSKFTNSISSNLISAITSDAKKNLWIGTEGKGLNYYDRRTGKFRNFQNDPADPSSLGSNFIKAIYEDHAGNIWIGLHQGGLDLFLPSSGKFRHYRHNRSDREALSRDNISYLLEDSRHNLWVGTAFGLDLFDRSSGKFVYSGKNAPQFKLSSKYVRVIYEDSGKRFWVGTAKGLNLLNPGARTFRKFEKGTKAGSLLSSYINCIREDKRGVLWVGTYNGGLSCYQQATGSFKNYTEKDGIISNNVIDIQEDNQGALWISTDKGLSRLDADRKNFHNYTVNDGLPANEFNYNSSFKDAEGRLFFGSYNGLLSFQPSELKQNTKIPPLVFTALKLFNNPVNINGKDGLLSRDINMTKEIVFSYDQNIFTIEFAALSFIRPSRNKYAYKLEGFEKDWNYVNNPSATYTNLPPGEYTFEVKGSNNDGLWSREPAKMMITILPPPWKTWWAYTLYILAGTGLFVLIIRFFRRQARLERDLYYEHFNAERQNELYQMKLDFFTKISHEIRTPLTLILAPIEKLIDKASKDPEVGKQLLYVKNNCDRLLRLISELLDFRKIETGNMKLQVAERDIVACCRNIYHSFHSVALSRNITFVFDFEKEPILVYFDETQMEKVVFNILSNAFKFTNDGGTIHTAVKIGADGSARIMITDDGPGIEPDKLDKIFSEFYSSGVSNSRADGWGIGLALSKTITELHKGTIEVESKPARGGEPGSTSFTVSLPAGCAHFAADEIGENIKTAETAQYKQYSGQLIVEEEALSEQDRQKKHSILIVEDNREVREFIKESLVSAYFVFESANGLQGWQTACSEIPDLIVCDVAMPEMDGLELCCKLKSDERTSHIPVIMLTARATHLQQIDGLEKGADAYITKPFSMHVLELTVRNLLLSREAMRQKFSNQVLLQPRNIVLESADEKFLGKLMKIIEEKMENPEFGVTALVNEIGMSQTVLYRKIKALTDLTIIDFIKSVRLKQAAQLLRQNQLSIAEVAYAVGFSDRKYFSKEFRKQFGKAPSDYIQCQQD